MSENEKAVLHVEGLVGGYPGRLVLADVSIDVAAGEIVALLGRNGAGKSTLLRTVFGLLPFWKGKVTVQGVAAPPRSPSDRRRSGVAYLPQGTGVFEPLTVQENLELGCVGLQRGSVHGAIESALTLFPLLRPRLRTRAGVLSGGEKRMLALASAMVLAPRLMLLDEPSLGLGAPMLATLFDHIRKLSENSGVAILIAEHRVRQVAEIAHRVYGIRDGVVVFSGRADTLEQSAILRQLYSHESGGRTL